MGKVVRRAFLLIRQLMDRVPWIRIESAGGDKQAARVAFVANAIREGRITRQYFLLVRQLFVKH
ncbi:hypothetical protein D3C71_1995170 [compost metagenome]